MIKLHLFFYLSNLYYNIKIYLANKIDPMEEVKIDNTLNLDVGVEDETECKLFREKENKKFGYFQN